MKRSNTDLINELLHTNYSSGGLGELFQEVTSWSAKDYKDFLKLVSILDAWLSGLTAIKDRDELFLLLEACKLGIVLGTARERYANETKQLEKMMK